MGVLRYTDDKKKLHLFEHAKSSLWIIFFNDYLLKYGEIC